MLQHIYLNFLISATRIFWTWEFLTGQHTVTYNNVNETPLYRPHFKAYLTHDIFEFALTYSILVRHIQNPLAS